MATFAIFVICGYIRYMRLNSLYSLYAAIFVICGYIHYIRQYSLYSLYAAIFAVAVFALFAMCSYIPNIRLQSLYSLYAAIFAILFTIFAIICSYIWDGGGVGSVVGVGGYRLEAEFANRALAAPLSAKTPIV